MKKPGAMLSEVLKHLFKKPNTTTYPFEKAFMPANYRGKIVFDSTTCVGCQLCVKDCPSFAIAINKVEDKVFEAVFELDRCVYCSQCVYSCPKKSLTFSEEFELAALNRKDLKYTFHAKPKQADTPPKAE